MTAQKNSFLGTFFPLTCVVTSAAVAQLSVGGAVALDRTSQGPLWFLSLHRSNCCHYNCLHRQPPPSTPPTNNLYLLHGAQWHQVLEKREKNPPLSDGHVMKRSAKKRLLEFTRQLLNGCIFKKRIWSCLFTTLLVTDGSLWSHHSW